VRVNSVLRLIVAVGLLAGLSTAWCAPQTHHILWEVKGRHNTVYLLGSVHMLRPDNSAVPVEALRAYDESKTLVMELDLNASGAQALAAPAPELELLPAGQTLAQVLGADLYAQFAAQAGSVGLDPALVEHSQPWFASLLLEQLELSKAGFNTASGVDMQFAQRAQLDGKSIIGLETLNDQLGIFAHLSPQQQRDYMRSTLENFQSDLKDTDKVVQAWQNGDTLKLEQLLREGSHDSPELYRMLTTDRNRKWLPKITQLLNDDSNYLIIVGALHLIGRDGVIELLRQRGYAAVQH
jgi:uncharacterized protein YbaP (TraB family)